jgi:DNA mismatch repair protein MSH2
MRLPTASDEQLLRKLIPQIQILSILKSGVVFTTSELRDAGGAFLEVDRRFEEEQRDIADKFVATAATYVPVGETCARLVAELDVLLSFAHVAAHCPAGEYVRPTFVDDDDAGRIELLGARHPCVEMQPGVSFIACDYDLGRSDSRFQIVTGPNMGGKSTYIRGLGSLVAMAQVALNELVTHRSV